MNTVSDHSHRFPNSREKSSAEWLSNLLNLFFIHRMNLSNFHHRLWMCVFLFKVGIVGKNGSGKSTLLSMLAGRKQPSSIAGKTGRHGLSWGIVIVQNSNLFEWLMVG